MFFSPVKVQTGPVITATSIALAFGGGPGSYTAAQSNQAIWVNQVQH
jgi:hypothetical protein